MTVSVKERNIAVANEDDPTLAWALARYQVISAYLALDPPRGQRGPTRDKLAQKTWLGPDGEPMEVKAETIRVWIRRYKKKGLQGLKNQEPSKRGVQKLTADEVQVVCQLKTEVPERSLDRLIRVAEDTGLFEPGVLRRSTVHRVLRAHGLSKRSCKIPNAEDLDRFEADFTNDLWQSDMLKGPWLPDPKNPGKVRRAFLFAFLDDHSRLLLYGRFFFREDLPCLELVFRRAVQKYGVPRRLYYDNGQVYRSNHMKQLVAVLGIHRLIFTQAYRPMGHGKIEALNRLIRGAFLAELKASNIKTLDALNEAFIAWADYEYNRRLHSEIKETPVERYKRGLKHVRYVDEAELHQAFLWKELRTPDKSGVLSLMGTQYQVGPGLAKRRVEVRFDPEALHEVEIWHQGQFVERVRPLDIRAHRRPRQSKDGDASQQVETAPKADWLATLVERRRKDAKTDPSLRQQVEATHERRCQADRAVLEILQQKLSKDVVDTDVVQRWLDRYGPVDPSAFAQTLETLLAQGEPSDRHVTDYLESFRQMHQGGEG